ncbi:Uncharacterised protein [uncultured archaeon]|nr:Uncharacterised protein [uncultured archaeon]
MNMVDYVRERFIYAVVLVCVMLVAGTIAAYNSGKIDNETAKIYLQALTAIATLALLFYAYFNMASQRKGEIAHLELAVRPIFIWELESKNSGAELMYKSQKHPIYDLHAVLKMGDKKLVIDERHIDVVEANPMAERRKNVTHFISGALGKEKKSLLEIFFIYHSEAGGRYEFFFTKEVVKKPHGLLFQHRKFISAKYPWNEERVVFTD